MIRSRVVERFATSLLHFSLSLYPNVACFCLFLTSLLDVDPGLWNGKWK